MKIVIATPLYPPDIAEPAPYVKELATRLRARHDTTIVLYGRLPENVPGVSFVCVDKRAMLPLRLLRYLMVLIREARRADVLYAMDGASVEIPARIASFLCRIPYIIHYGDQDANEWVERHLVLRACKQIALRGAKEVIRVFPLPRPEILPLEAYPRKAFDAYEASWDEHIELLEGIFAHYGSQ